MPLTGKNFYKYTMEHSNESEINQKQFEFFLLAFSKKCNLRQRSHHRVIVIESSGYVGDADFILQPNLEPESGDLGEYFP